jgi:hypothetical protein
VHARYSALAGVEPRDVDGRHGAGKGIQQRRVLMQIAERQETAIVYDPALEYTT